MERIYLTSKIYYENLFDMAKDIYKYPGRFLSFFKEQTFLNMLKKNHYDKYQAFKELQKQNYIDDVFLFKASYIFNPYMKLRYHHFLFESYDEIGKTILQYGPIIDVYLKDLLVYHLLSEYMEKQGDDVKQKKYYDIVKEAERRVEINENNAYWYLGFMLANTKTMTYERKNYDSPKEFFKERMDVSSMFSLASSLESNQLVYTWLQICGSEKELNEYKSMVNLFDNKEIELEEGKLNRITEKINKSK